MKQTSIDELFPSGKHALKDENWKRMIAVMKSYDRKSQLPHYDMWSKKTPSYEFKTKELDYVTTKCPKTSNLDCLSLDAGCGFGVYSSMLLSKGYSVVSLDVSVGMLKKARNLVNEDKIDFVRGSFTHLPFRSSIFDMILCVDTLHNLTDNFFEATLREFRRTIRKKRMLIIDTRNALNPFVHMRFMMADAQWAQIGGLTLKTRSPQYVKKKLRDNNFRVLETKEIGFDVKFLAPYVIIVSNANVEA